METVLDGARAEWAVWNATLRADGRVENLYGNWATFDRAGDYKLRSVDAALKDLTAAPRPLPAIATDLPAAARVTVGMPGMIRSGVVVHTPHYITRSGPRSRVVPALQDAWSSFDMQAAVEKTPVPV